MSKFRCYSNNKLVTWRQRQCTLCGRFLARKQKKYCSRCAHLQHLTNWNKRSKRNYAENRKEILEKMKKIYWMKKNGKLS